MTHKVLLGDQPREYVEPVDEDSRRIVKNNLVHLEDDPYPRPASGRGDVEQLTVDGEEIYRMHIGRTHTAFFTILEDEGEVRIVELLPIDEAHERYGF